MNWDFNINPDVIWHGYVLPWGVQLLMALLVFLIGRLLAKALTRMAAAAMTKAKLDPILTEFLTTVAGSALTLLVIVLALSQLGLDTTSLVALLGAAGLAVGLALKDSLSHFAAGTMLILFRPFKVGDYVEVDGVAGSVSRITIFSTRLTTPDNRVVTVPNGNVFGNTMTNYSEEKLRRIDLVIGIDYGSDLRLAKQLLIDLLERHPKILKDPAHTVAVSELADSSVNFVVRPWVKAEDYWPVRFELLETIKLRFDEAGIEIPFPQMTIHSNSSD
ncbi:mechanosensitive ion channel protein [Bacterioplanes sanyensis]|uniref:mechanosensitive ion channel family protein n=1 Tax=Bacterioplanes sanyensis TaxID=1249553 RepID=UPI00167C3B0F|nr:mechanosensitive ion channel domain-containing protein [Bacterioplanes sanyensis]GGY57173.1 mechanosensitive ion channel protein [Bacterioplanes sanyensis]